MRFNSRGEYHGGRVGIGSWLNDDTWLTQAEIGSAWLACGGDRWVDSTQSCRSNFDYAYPEGLTAKVWDMARDGTVVEVPNYHMPYSCGVWPAREQYGIFDEPVRFARALVGGDYCVLVGYQHVWSSRHGWIQLPAGIQAFEIAECGDVLCFTTHLHTALLNVVTGLGRRVLESTLYPDLFAEADGVILGYGTNMDDVNPQILTVPFASLTDDLSTLSDSTTPPDPPDPPDPPQPVEAPHITIGAYDANGVAPCDCVAEAELSGGEATTITWVVNEQDEPIVEPLELTHTYHFAAPGSYRIGVKVVGPGGSDETGTPRVITVTADVPPPDPIYPPIDPPAGGGKFMSTIQLSEPAFLNWRYGGGQSLDPPTKPDDPNRDPFEHGRPVAGVDETAQLFQFTDGTYGIQSPNGRSWLSIQRDGSYEERPVVEDEEPGSFERFTLAGNVLTELPKDEADATRDPVTFVQP